MPRGTLPGWGWHETLASAELKIALKTWWDARRTATTHPKGTALTPPGAQLQAWLVALFPQYSTLPRTPKRLTLAVGLRVK